MVGSLINGDRAQRIRNGFKLSMASDRYQTVNLASLELEGWKPREVDLVTD